VTRWLGRRRIDLETCPSTSDEAARLARAGCENGTVVTSAAQTAGRGRQGRSWHSAAGNGVYLSAVLRLPLAPADVPGLTLAIGIAVCDAVRRAGAPAGLKWPNDIVVRGPDGARKLGGILSETTSVAGRIDAVIVGIGVNLLGELPAAVAETAITLDEAAGTVVDRDAFILQVLANVERWVDRYAAVGLPAVIPAWQARMAAGLAARATVDGESKTGLVAGLGLDGSLLLRDDEGKIHRVRSGDVEVMRPGSDLV
jgi:BirA family biotin operon repressor/biotin-[acetyl-CoA-carboxylase] ligase